MKNSDPKLKKPLSLLCSSISQVVLNTIIIVRSMNVRFEFLLQISTYTTAMTSRRLFKMVLDAFESVHRDYIKRHEFR